MSARNEEDILPQVLEALNKQSHPLQEIVVVNDGSTDATADIAVKHGAIVIDLPYHPHSILQTQGGLAKRLNEGLRILKPCDYVLVMGADDILPPHYVAVLLARMEQNPKLVVASGQIKGQPTAPSSPRGGGRLVKTWFWKKVSDMRFPVSWCWEGAILYKANQLGYKTKAYPDLLFQRVRKDEGKRDPQKAFGSGKGMYALGFFWLYALLRCLYVFFRSRQEAWYLYLGWRSREGVEQVEFAQWVSNMQKWHMIGSFTMVHKVIDKIRREMRR